MPRIRILSDQVANQIAAGEVVERPVNVIKELIENSLDAGAKRIEVEFRSGGKSYMRVMDDGCGMSPDEAMLSLERHATSKIEEAEDLMRVRSFGFRGEAIPSIASVSRFTLRTRTVNAGYGCEILVNAGKLIHRRDHGMAVGTQVEVANLFNSVPVRRKFMKTENTEAAHITYLVRLYAVGHPEVGFTLIENGRQVFKSFVSEKLVNRVGSVWNQKLSKELIEIRAEEGGMRVWGLISKPGVGRATRQEMVTFVNGRPVESKTLNYALSESYHTYLPKGRYPVVFLFLEIDPEWVDVNVHPAKREVRFRDDGVIRQFIITVLLDALKKLNQESLQLRMESKEVVLAGETAGNRVLAGSSGALVPQLAASGIGGAASGNAVVSHFSVPLVSQLKEDGKGREPWGSVVERGGVKHEERQEEVKDLARYVPSWRFIGGFRGSYGLFEAPGGLVVMNYKRARQRVLYEKIQKGFKEGGADLSQPLLMPIGISLDPLTSAIFGECLEALNKGGLQVVVFGRNFYRVEAVPPWLDASLAEVFVKDVAALVREHGAVPRTQDLLHEKIAHMAVTQTFRFEGGFSDSEVGALVRALFSCDNPLTCPRGKPTYFELSTGDLDRRFGRLF